ncbi:hypothetical protein BKM32_07465 [Mangrovimonas sp. DI 80]|nr:hypothetical protein BKM32_07465 [Mangrovimonas sp. DI 80]
MTWSFCSFAQSEEKVSEEIEVSMVMLDTVVLNCYSYTRTCRTYTCGSCVVKIEEGSQEESQEGLEIETSELAVKQNVLYPNPSSTGIFNIKLAKDYETLEMHVYAITGQKVLSQNLKRLTENISLDLSRFPSGVYLVNLVGDGEKLPVKKAVFH